MNRKTLTVEQLENAGYKAFAFSDFTLENAVEYIRSGCETRLEPRYYGAMVAIVIIKSNGHVYEKEMFSRAMTDTEKKFYSNEMKEQEKKFNELSAKIHAKNKAKLR